MGTSVMGGEPKKRYEFIGFFVPKNSPVIGIPANKDRQPGSYPAEVYIEKVGTLIKRHRFCLN